MTVGRVTELVPQMDREMPNDALCERAIIGSTIISASSYFRVASLIGEDDFFRDANRVIYSAIKHLCEVGDEVDLISLRDCLTSRGKLDSVGGLAYVSSLVDGIPDVANVEKYARIVKEKADLRRIILLGNSMMRQAMDADPNYPDDKPAAICAHAAAALQGMAVGVARGSRHLWDAMRDVQRDRDAQRASGRDRRVRVGFPMIDSASAIRRQAMTVVSAPSSHGKTTLMLNFAVGAVRSDEQTRVGLFSLEMSDEDIHDPLISMMTGVMLRRIQDGEVNDFERADIRAAMSAVEGWKEDGRFWFSDRIRDVESIHADAMKRKVRDGLDMIVVDYLQLIRGMDDRTREQEIDRITRSLRYVGQDLNVAVVVGSQVNKDRQHRTSGRLSNTDHKQGAVIGEHADVVMMFQRPRQDDKSADGQEGRELIPWCQTAFQIEKNRGHETGDIPMHADMTRQTFSEGTCEQNNCYSLRR